jgi:hypothetical protein
MIIAIAFAQVWGVIQLIVVGSLARTIRMRTVLAALAVGLYACAPVAALLQIAGTRSAAWITGGSIHHMVGVAAYTVDPFIEEIVKVLPLVALLMMPSIRRQWSITDCILMGAAVGSGLGLAENLYRFGASPYQALAINGGWSLATSGALPFVPSVWTTLTSWLPPGTAPGDIYFPGISGQPWVNLHLAWSAIGGLAIGLIWLDRRTVARIAGAFLLLYVGIDHMAWNAASADGSWVKEMLVGPFASQRHLLGLLPIAALAIAWWLDRQRQRDNDGDDLTLAGEQFASFRLLGTLRASVSRLPGSLLSVYSFARLRRAYNSARTFGSADETKNLRTMVAHARDLINRQLVQPKSAPLLAPVRGAKVKVIRWLAIIIWLVLMMPPIFWFVIAGWPQTAWLQTVMTAPVTWKILLGLSVATQAWLAWRLVVAVRMWPKSLRLPVGDDAAIVGLRIICGAGGIGFGGYVLMRAFTGLAPTIHLLNNVHVQEAYADATPATSVQLGNGAVGAMPPPPPSKGSSTYIGDVDDPKFVGDETPDDEIPQPEDDPPEMSLDDMATWAKEADAREAEAADAKAADAANAADAAADAADAAAARYEAAQDEYEAAYAAYVTDIDAAKIADDAARIADPDAAPHAAADVQAEAVDTAKELKEKVEDAREDAAATRYIAAQDEQEAAHAAYEADMPAARAADAAARAADPNATPHAAADVQAAAEATKKQLDAKLADAEAAVEEVVRRKREIP